jgi:hypothetical protein
LQDALIRSRDAPSHPGFAHAKKNQAKKKPVKKTPPLKEGRRSAEKRTTRSRIEKRCGARPFSRLSLSSEKT